MARFISSMWASMFPSHSKDCASLDEPQIISRLYEELCYIRFIGHVRGEG